MTGVPARVMTGFTVSGASAVVNGVRFSTAIICFEPSGRTFTANHFVTAKSWVLAGSHQNSHTPFTGIIGEPIIVPVVDWTSHVGFVSPSGSDMLYEIFAELCVIAETVGTFSTVGTS